MYKFSNDKKTGTVGIQVVDTEATSTSLTKAALKLCIIQFQY